MIKKQQFRKDKSFRKKRRDPKAWARKYLKDDIVFIKSPKGKGVFGVGKYKCQICGRRTTRITVERRDGKLIERCEEC